MREIEIKALKTLRQGSFDSYHSTSFEDIYHKEFEILQQALERNVAKKPVFWAENDLEGLDCPNCKEQVNPELYDEYENEYFNMNYCPNCGQRLDWGE